MNVIKLNPDPTFKAAIGVSVAGQPVPVPVDFEFKYFPADEREAFFKKLDADGASIAETLEQLIVGWGKQIDTVFSVESLRQFLRNYPAAGSDIWLGYLREVGGSKVKN